MPDGAKMGVNPSFERKVSGELPILTERRSDRLSRDVLLKDSQASRDVAIGMLDVLACVLPIAIEGLAIGGTGVPRRAGSILAYPGVSVLLLTCPSANGEA